jgi:hypothetical protein
MMGTPKYPNRMPRPDEFDSMAMRAIREWLSQIFFRDISLREARNMRDKYAPPPLYKIIEEENAR